MLTPTLQAQHSLFPSSLGSQIGITYTNTEPEPSSPPKPSELDSSSLRPASHSHGAIYCYGSITARFPSLSLEKEFYQTVGSNPPSDYQAFNIDDEASLIALNQMNNLNAALYQTLSQPDNRYIAREMCWVLTSTSGRDIYAIEPGKKSGLDLLINALQPNSQGQVSPIAFIGEEGPLTSNPGCNILQLPSAHIHRIFTPAVNTIAQSSSGTDPNKFSKIVDQALQLTQNAGNSDADRALNYVLLNDTSFYLRTYGEQYPSDNSDAAFSLASANTLLNLPSSNTSTEMKVIFEYESESSAATKKGFSIIDVSSPYPFSVSDFTRFLQRK